MNALKKIDAVIAGILKILVICMCSSIALILFVRVIIRFTPINTSLSWTDEIVELLMAWMIFTASTLIMRDKAHFKVDILQERYKGKAWMDILNIAITVLSIIFIASLFHYGCQLVSKAVQHTSIMKLPMRYLYASVPVNAALMLIYLVRDLVTGVTDFAKKHIQKKI